jgi:hypothetical protein
MLLVEAMDDVESAEAARATNTENRDASCDAPTHEGIGFGTGIATFAPDLNGSLRAT